MKLPAKMNPALVASKDKTRYVLEHVLVTPELAVATDARRLLAMCVDDTEADKLPALLPAPVVAAACKSSRKHVFAQQVEIGETTATVREIGEARVFDLPHDTPSDRFPNFWKVIPDTSKHTLRLALNVELLAGLAKAMGAGGNHGGVTLHLDPDNLNGGMIVTAHGPENDRAVGVLMPMRRGDEADDLSKNRALDRIALHAEAAIAEANPSTPAVE